MNKEEHNGIVLRAFTLYYDIFKHLTSNILTFAH